MVAELTTPMENRLVDLTLIDRVKQQIMLSPRVEGPVKCVFTPGLMTRFITMSAGERHLSKLHKTHHQFFILSGSALVSENGAPPQLYSAPFHGETKPGTWRELFILSESVWATVHPTDKTTVEEVERDIIEPTEEKQ